MKKLSFLIITVIIALSTFAQENRVAVFDPEDPNNTGYKDMVREILSTAIAKSDKYKPVERVLINKVLEENKYQKTGMVKDSEVSELGKQMGANFVCISIIRKIGSNFFITAKLVNVTTAMVESQEHIKTENGVNDLYEKTEELANKLLSIKSETATNIKYANKSGSNYKLPTVEINYQVYMVLPEDLNGKYTWQQAKNACENLNGFGYDDWFLPEIHELKTLYENKDAIGGFKQKWTSCFYWSNTSANDMSYSLEPSHFGIGFRKGLFQIPNPYPDYNSLNVRCVRKVK